MNKRLWWLLLFLSGCASIPVHELADPRESSGCSGVVSEAMNQKIIDPGDWPNWEWWRDFDEPVLTQLLEHALSSSPTLGRAEANLKAACQKAFQKKSLLFPQLDFLAADDWVHLSRYGILRAFAPTVYPPVINETIFGVSFSYEFDFWGKNRALFRAALGQATALAAERMQAELILTTSIVYTYIELQLLLQKKHLLSQIKANAQAIEAIRERREQNALDSSLKKLQAASKVLDWEAELIEFEEQIEMHIHKLKALADWEQDAKLEIALRPLNPLVFGVPECLCLDLIGRRPDLIAQKARVEAAAKEIDAAKTEFYPNINLKAFLGLASIFWNQLFSTKSYVGDLTPALHLPLFNAGRLRANLMEKAADFNEAVYAYNELIVKAAQEITDTLSRIGRYQKEAEVRKGSAEIAQKQEHLVVRRFENALDDRMQVLDAKNAALEAEISLAEIEFGRQLAGVDLIRFLGGGYHE